VSRRFEELDWRATPIGEVSLRRRIEPSLQREVYEVKLGDEYLMSSLFTVAEEELATLALAQLGGNELDVIVGGLGLGYTAQSVLADPRVRSLEVVEALEAVIDWHQRGLLPLSGGLTSDARCRLVHGDFFARVAAGDLSRCHALVVDIDHSPRHVLHPSHAPFYEAAGLRQVLDLLHPDGVFALWSDDPPDDAFLTVMREVFVSAEAQVVRFANPLTGGESANSVYVAKAP
jgi:spermidine synthase